MRRAARELVTEVGQEWKRHGRVRAPGLWAVAVYRLGRFGRESDSAVAGLIAAAAYGAASLFLEVAAGVTIPRRTTIGRDFHAVHGMNIIIHPDAVIGDRVSVMHEVTIGLNEAHGKGAPVIEDDVFIGPGAKILGPVRIGKGAQIVANSVVITDVPAGAVAMGVPARPIPARTKPDASHTSHSGEPPAKES
jgi:serine O-acetyltransferase